MYIFSFFITILLQKVYHYLFEHFLNGHDSLIILASPVHCALHSLGPFSRHFSRPLGQSWLADYSPTWAIDNGRE